jgi:hypothetical protein
MPGDLLFFSFNGTIVDHVAMYVGPTLPGGDDVVQASSPGVGIISSKKNTLKTLTGFLGFRRVSAAQIGLSIVTHSPVTLSVTDPDGNTINSSTLITTLRERLREVSGILYYTEDSNGDDVVYAPMLKAGTYSINVLPKPGISPTATFGLDVSLASGQTVSLAQNVPVSKIPSLGYVIESDGATVKTATPYLTARIVTVGQQAPGVLFLDFQVTNSGGGPAYQVSINNLQFRTLTGSGVVAYNSSLGQPLPLILSALGIGSSNTVRLYFNVPSTVRRFSIVENASVNDATGVTYAISLAQTVIP